MNKHVWEFDPAHTSVEFRIRHAAISWVRGSFHKREGSLVFDPEHPEKVSVEFTVDVSSVDTRVKDRDDHLRSSDFFDVVRFPVMTFASTGVVATGKGRYALTGELALHGVTKRVTFDVAYNGCVTESGGTVRAGFEATATLDRRDFGLVWNQTMEEAGVLVGDLVEVTLEIEAVRS